jgi:hypothetical protein
MRSIDGSAFDDNPLQEMRILPGSTQFRMFDRLLSSLCDRKAIRYFGRSPVVTVLVNITETGECCFAILSAVRDLSLMPDCAMRTFGNGAFDHSGLRFIVVGKSVERLGSSCFTHTHYLKEVRFEPGSHLTSISDWAFSKSSLQSIHLPKKVRNCGRLVPMLSLTGLADISGTP